MLRRAVERSERAVLLPELLPDDEEWRLDTTVRFSSHRPVIGPAIVFVKRRLLLPIMRWLVDYNRDNFRRQQRVNRLLGRLHRRARHRKRAAPPRIEPAD